MDELPVNWHPGYNRDQSLKKSTTEQIRNRSQVTKWLANLTDDDLHDLLAMMHSEGCKRGFGNYWTE